MATRGARPQLARDETAPNDPGHAASAVRAALRCQQRLGELNATVEPFKSRPLGQRIGLNSGEVLVGNIGSRRRFNYTVMGDAVNLASRLEGANKYFGTSIMASEATVELAGAGFVWRELDWIRVKGRTQPVRIYEPRPEQTTGTSDYAQGLDRWRAHDFAGAANCFRRSAATDPAAAAFLQRVVILIHQPPGPDWEPINTLDGK